MGLVRHSPEKRMVEGVCRGDSLLWYPFEALLDQVSCLDDIFAAISRAGIGHHDLNQIDFAKVLIPVEKLHDGSFTNLS